MPERGLLLFKIRFGSYCLRTAREGPRTHRMESRDAESIDQISPELYSSPLPSFLQQVRTEQRLGKVLFRFCLFLSTPHLS